MENYNSYLRSQITTFQQLLHKVARVFDVVNIDSLLVHLS